MFKVFRKTLLYILVVTGILVCMLGCTRIEEVKTSKESEISVSEKEFITETGQNFDFSNFSFTNMYEMNEWIKIDNFFFADTDGVINIEGAYQVVSFENGFMEARDFDGGQVFNGDRSQGEVDVVLSYKVVSDKLLSIQKDRNPILEITEVQVLGGIPVISLEFTSGGYNLYHLDGTYIPTEFIDLARESFSHNSIHGYYLKKEYFDSKVEKFYEFATSIIEAAYVDFDASILVESLHPIYREEIENNDVDFKSELSKMLSHYEKKYGKNIEYQIGKWNLKNAENVNVEDSDIEDVAGELIISLRETGYDVDAAGVLDVTIKVAEQYKTFELWVVEMGSKMYYVNPEFCVLEL